ncbi:FKBP-type peptidyl-prolyl cis-trans isomerase N-terminal domain-containing protein [Frateuria aurantia]
MKYFLRPTLTAVALAVAMGVSAGAMAQKSSGSTAAAPAVDKAKASYLVGWQLAGQLPPLVREEIDPAIVARALQAALSGQKPTMTDAEAQKVGEAFQNELRTKFEAEMARLGAKNQAEGAAFLAKNKTAPGVKVTASGLQYQVITPGTGPRPGPNDTVEVNYSGAFIDGQVFDDSAHHGNGPASIPLANVIPGFREGLQLMQAGGHYKFFIPSSLAYGARPQPPMQPNATLVFDVTLVKSGPTPAGGAAPAQGGGE